MPIPINLLPPHIVLKLHPPNKQLTDALQPRHENAKQARNDKHTDTLSDLQPAPLIPDLPEEPQRQIISNPHDDGEQAPAPQPQTFREDAEIRRDQSEGRKELEKEQGALRERVEDGDEAVDGVEGEGGDGGDVAGAEEGGLQEEEEEEADAGVGEGEGAVVAGLQGAVASVGGVGGGGERGCWEVGFEG